MSRIIATPGSTHARLLPLLLLPLVLCAPVQGQSPPIQNEDATLAAPAGTSGFATALDMSGNTLVVGGSPATVYLRNGLTWSQEGTLSGALVFNEFGSAVAVDGNTAMVGAPGESGWAGAVHVFTRSAGTWSFHTKLLPASPLDIERFGTSISLSGDTVAVGAPGDDGLGTPSEGSVEILTRTNNSWSIQQVLVPPTPAQGDRFGLAVALEGDVLVVGAWGDPSGTGGQAYVYRRQGSTWTLEDTLAASDPSADARFGSSVALSGGTAVVGAYRAGTLQEGAAYVFVENGGAWSEVQRLAPLQPIAQDAFGYDVDVDGDRLLVSNRGGVDLPVASQFTRESGVWTRQADLQPGDSQADVSSLRPVALAGLFGSVGHLAPNDDAVHIHRLDSPWYDLGGSSTGADGDPILQATGTLTSGSPVRFDVQRAPPSSLMVAWLSFTSTPLSAFGATIYANPLHRAFVFSSNAQGSLSLPLIWPQFIPAGIDVYLQFFVSDPSVPNYGFSVSNAVMSTTP